MEQTLDALHGEPHDVESARSLQATYQQQLQQYLDSLPRLPIARCPFTDELLEATIDNFGLDGVWWDRNGPGSLDLQQDPHHLVTLGALDLCGQEPHESDRPLIQSIELGPAVPYLIPRLMKIESMRCVIHSLAIADGRYWATLMSYFSDPPLPAAEGHQPWLRGNFSFEQDGHVMWKRCEEAWDFELRPWVAEEPARVFWIDPGDFSMTLHSGAAKCPFLDLPGSRSLQVIRAGRLVPMEPRHAATPSKEKPC